MTCCSHPFIHTMYKNDQGTVINKMANTTCPLVSTSTFISFSTISFTYSHHSQLCISFFLCSSLVYISQQNALYLRSYILHNQKSECYNYGKQELYNNRNKLLMCIIFHSKYCLHKGARDNFNFFALIYVKYCNITRKYAFK